MNQWTENALEESGRQGDLLVEEPGAERRFFINRLQFLPTVSKIWGQKTAYILFSAPIASSHEVFAYKLLRATIG